MALVILKRNCISLEAPVHHFKLHKGTYAPPPPQKKTKKQNKTKQKQKQVNNSITHTSLEHDSGLSMRYPLLSSLHNSLLFTPG